MKTDRPKHDSGKTKFNKGKLRGESWCDHKAIAEGRKQPYGTVKHSEDAK